MTWKSYEINYRRLSKTLNVMPEGTAVLDRPPISAPPRDITPLDLPQREIPREPIIPPPTELVVPSITDIADEPNITSDQTHQDTEELRRRVLESMGLGAHNFDDNHSPLPMDEETHSEKKKGIMSKISEFFKGGSKLSKIAKFSAIPFALLAMILMKGFKGSKREQ